jgi:iron complex outermembrane receptor protein
MRSLLWIGAATTSICTAQAQTADPQTGEIVVTATRKAEPLSKVAISVSAFSQETLDKRGIKDFSGIVRQTPGIQFDNTGFGNRSVIAIRGVASDVGAATTGIYIDDTPIQTRQFGYTSTNTTPAVFDLDRVEVLRGPQGTLFGAGSQGGTVRFITPQPDTKKAKIYARAEGSATQGGAPSGEFGVSVNVPLQQDRLALSLSAWIRRDGGYIDRKNGNPALSNATLSKNVNSGVTKVLRGALTWKPAEGLEITPSIFFQKVDQNDMGSYWETLSNPSKGSFLSGQPLASPDRDKFYLPALAVSYATDDIKLISNTSYFVRDQASGIDYSALWPAVFGRSAFVPGVPGYTALAENTNSQRTFTQELRLQSNSATSRLNWVVGAFYSKSIQRFTEYVYDPSFDAMLTSFFGAPASIILGMAPLQGKYSLAGSGRGTDEQLAGFGDVNYAITDKLKASAGLRVARTKFTGATIFDGPVPGLQIQNPGSTSETPVTPKFALNYQATPSLLVYANAAKGYRIGGVNAPVPLSTCGADLKNFGFSQSPEQYKSDNLWSYEAGAKGKLDGGRITFGASAFHVDWSNIQQKVYLSRCGAQFVANLGQAQSNGFDLQGSARVSDGLTLDGSLSYTNARFTGTVPGGAGNLATSGNRLDTHPWTVTAGLIYDGKLGADLPFYVRADYQYKSAGRAGIANDRRNASYDPNLYPLPAFGFASLRLGTRFNGLDASVFVDNLTNTHPVTSRLTDVVGVGSYRNGTLRPRTFGLTVTYRH